MNSILLKASAVSSKLPVGSSKLLGNPDVWEGFEWPAIDVDGELYDLTFMCQINCEEAVPFDKDGILPKTGMLYFFYDLDEMPSSPEDVDASRVIYYNGSISSLHEMVLTDENGQSIAFGEQKLSFECVKDGHLSDSEPTHLLLGSPSLDVGMYSDFTAKHQMLLQIDSFETDDAVINFTDEGMLCFFAEPEKIKQLDFSDVRIMQIHS